MRSFAVGTARWPVQGEELPGIVSKRRCGIAGVTIALALSLFGPSLAQADAPIPERVSGAASQQSAPVPERISGGASQQSAPVPERISDAPAAAVSEPTESAPAVAPAAAAAPAAASDDGLGALAIVLISVGGCVALAGVAYTARRVMRHGYGHAAG